MFMWLYMQELIKLGYCPAKFGGYRPFDSGNIVVLVCLVISQDYLIKESSDFMGRSPTT